MEHFTNKSNSRWFIWIFFSELNSKFKSTVLEGCVVGPKYNSIPYHNVIISWRS
ncbi:GSCOCG00008128001-RA-CDS [Cotesia congregata]|nr:GSCOCG00008128001-RA-CDS [Cotesia congregata]